MTSLLNALGLPTISQLVSADKTDHVLHVICFLNFSQPHHFFRAPQAGIKENAHRNSHMRLKLNTLVDAALWARIHIIRLCGNLELPAQNQKHINLTRQDCLLHSCLLSNQRSIRQVVVLRWTWSAIRFQVGRCRQHKLRQLILPACVQPQERLSGCLKSFSDFMRPAGLRVEGICPT